MESEIIKWNTGKYLVPVQCTYTKGSIEFKFRYNKAIMAEIKTMEGHHWHGYDDVNPRKIWSIKDSVRNAFALAHVKGENPYAPYDVELKEFESNRPLYDHQRLMTSHNITVNHGIWAAEMGTGKSLSSIEVMEYAFKQSFLTDNREAWYIGPRSGVRAVGRELLKWDSRIRPRMFTYEGLVKEVRTWVNTKPTPKVVVFDESSKIKTPTAQRSQAAMHLADAIREEYGRDGYIIEMSGTPAPKTPVDWWHQCEVACPGFLREGDIGKFKRRLCLVEQRESTITGGMYPHIVTWWDDENKCQICGQVKDHANHDKALSVFGDTDTDDTHDFQRSVNEVAYLHQRMKGLVVVLFKKDCMDLPEKQYEDIYVKPAPETLRAARLIRKITARGAQVSLLLRELSDGFQYTEREIGKEPCPNCFGKGQAPAVMPAQGEDGDDLWNQPTTDINDDTYTGPREMDCPNCGGSGKVPIMERTTKEIGTPKDQAFIDELDAHDDVGRYIAWGGFQATVDRLERVAHQHGWSTLKIDGRGVVATNEKGVPVDADNFFDAMDRSHHRFKEFREKYSKLCVVGNPGAGGMAYTFTASPTMLYFSNTNGGEDRMQSEDRGHRPGIDENRGLTIKDLIHMPIDIVVKNNGIAKKDMQAMSLGDLKHQLEEAEKQIEEQNLIEVPNEHS